MFDKKEVVAIVLSSIFLGFALSLWYFLSAATEVIDNPNYLQFFLTLLVFIFIIIVINSLAKKVAAYYFDSNLKIRIWEIKRIGYKPGQHFSSPFFAGIIIPLVTSFISLGYFVWLSPLVFDAEPTSARASKRHGLYSRYYMNESHIGLIAAFGILVSLFFAYVGYLLGFPEFSKLSLYFVLFNMVPFSDLDGAKIIFGNMALWFIMVAISIIGVLIGIMIL